MQLGALVVTSRRTFDIFDCQANKPIAGLASPIGLQTFGRRLQEREEGNMDDRKRLSKLGVKARLRSLTRKAGVYLHVRQLLSTGMAIGVWWGGAVTTSALQLLFSLAEQRKTKHVALTLAITQAKTFELDPRPLDVTRISQSHDQ